MLLTPSALGVLVSAWLAGCWLALTSSTPYLGDDDVNKDVRSAAVEMGTGLLGVIGHYTQEWMELQGRFFPGSLGWSYSVFWFTDGRVAYKFLLGAVLFGCIAVFALLCATLVGRFRVAPVFVALAFGCLQIRVGIDGLISFTGLVPLTAGLCAAAVVLLIRGRGWLPACAAVLLYSAALVTYETVILFAPVMAAVVVIWRRRWIPALAVILPAAIQGAIVIFLRHAVDTKTAPAYTTNLDPEVVLRTFANQASASLPLSQWLFRAPDVPPIDSGSLTLAVLVCGVPVLASMLAMGSSPWRQSRRVIASIAVFGLWIWLSSAALIAVTVRWQDQLQPGQGYLSVIYGYLGCALVATALWLAAGNAVAGRSAAARRAWNIGSSLVIAAVVSATMAGNFSVTALM